MSQQSMKVSIESCEVNDNNNDDDDDDDDDMMT